MKIKPTKCEIKGCKNEACAWIWEEETKKNRFVCQNHFYKIKNPPKPSARWLDKYLKQNETNNTKL